MLTYLGTQAVMKAKVKVQEQADPTENPGIELSGRAAEAVAAGL